MHQFSIPLVFSLFFTFSPCFSQLYIPPPPVRTPGSLNSLPLIVTGAAPDIYLPGDSVKIPHLRTHIVEINSTINLDNNYLIERIKRAGIEQGVDGIILNEYRKLTPVPEGMVGSLSGIGIKYIERINYLDTILKQKVIATFEPDGKRGKSIVLNFNWKGNILNPVNSDDFLYYADSMAFIDLNVIFNRISDFYQYKAYEGQPVHKIITGNDCPMRINHTVRLTNEGTVEFSTSKYLRLNPTLKNMRVNIKPVYDNNLITGAIITLPNGKTPLYYLYYKYDNKGRITNEIWEKLINGKRTLWLEIENRFFENDEIYTK